MFDRRIIRGRILIVGIVVFLAGLIAASDALHGQSEEILAAVEILTVRFPVLGPVLFVLLAMASAMLFFFSSAVLFPFGVNAWGATASLFLLWLGWLLGGAASYAVGRLLGRSVTARLVGAARISDFETRLRTRARFFHILLFQMTLPSEIPGYVLGTLRYPFWPYLGALAIAEVPYALGTAFLGISFLDRRAGLLIALGIGAVVLSVVAYLFYKRAGTPG